MKINWDILICGLRLTYHIKICLLQFQGPDKYTWPALCELLNSIKPLFMDPLHQPLSPTHLITMWQISWYSGVVLPEGIVQSHSCIWKQWPIRELHKSWSPARLVNAIFPNNFLAIYSVDNIYRWIIPGFTPVPDAVVSNADTLRMLIVRLVVRVWNLWVWDRWSSGWTECMGYCGWELNKYLLGAAKSREDKLWITLPLPSLA